MKTFFLLLALLIFTNLKGFAEEPETFPALTPPEGKAIAMFDAGFNSAIDAYQKEIEQFNSGQIKTIDFNKDDVDNVWERGQIHFENLKSENLDQWIKARHQKYLEVRAQLAILLSLHPGAVTKADQKNLPVDPNLTKTTPQQDDPNLEPAAP